MHYREDAAPAVVAAEEVALPVEAAVEIPAAGAQDSFFIVTRIRNAYGISCDDVLFSHLDLLSFSLIYVFCQNLSAKQ